ncbi:tail fiber domain-containing protein [Suttonella ornithocola]|uniref:Peptidase S74 domain-containing protein n=1 Tax=Suttonella ornithocola TaxID=279832 RepID=A0A380RB72_9GAMM|nr:tail fiber domain-containing protein [Suttonella ornithocola]SUO95296.1 Uncharacterised protein [Suttonella ornithocola]SUQ09752.1 Uncharacterised protein [Suttonella ornithocola]
MSIQQINLGTAPAGADGDTVRTGFDKTNQNINKLSEEKANKSGDVFTGVIRITGNVPGGFSHGLQIQNSSSAVDSGRYIDFLNEHANIGSIHCTSNENGSSKIHFMTTPEGNISDDRRQWSATIDENGAIWARAYGGLLDSYFAKQKNSVFSGNVTVNCGIVDSWHRGIVLTGPGIHASSDNYSRAPALISKTDKGGMEAWFFAEEWIGHEHAALIALNGFDVPTKIWKFNSAGNATAPGSWLNGSDIRRKDNITPIDNALDKIAVIQPITYTMDGQKGAGYSAQEVKAQLPEVVFDVGEATDKNGEKITDALAINYGGMSALNTQAIKELLIIVEQQAEKIKTLEEKINALDG